VNETILIVTPFRNEDHSIPYYIEVLNNLTYPHDLIDVYWLENDSTDNTTEILMQHYDKHDFRNLCFDSVDILMKKPVKRKPGAYWKDIPYRVRRRGIAWLAVWNDYLMPAIQKSSCDYVLVWFADGIPPADVIEEYLKIFNEYDDAGWVGGGMHRRHPKHNEICSPRPRWPLAKGEITEVRITSHVWMNQRGLLEKCNFRRVERSTDMHMSLSRDIANMGYKIYYTPDVYIYHVSTDGKIYNPQGKVIYNERTFRVDKKAEQTSR